MAEAFLDTLLETKQEDLAKESHECCICLENIKAEPLKQSTSERPVRLPCTHLIHIDCIAIWLSTSRGQNTCPMCRHILFPVVQQPTTAETELAAARQELQLFYGTNQLLQRGINGEPDLYDVGQNFIERLNPSDWQITNTKQYFQRRMTLPNPEAPPRTTKDARTRCHRNTSELRTYLHLLKNYPQMPPVTLSEELGPYHLDAMYTTLSIMGVFDELWGPRTAQNTQGPSRRGMYDLMRDFGYAYYWREGCRDNCFRRCGWRLPGRLRDPSSLSENARALLERQPLPDQERIRAARQAGQRRGGLDAEPAGSGSRQDSQPSPARRMLQWYRRHWWRGFAIN